MWIYGIIESPRRNDWKDADDAGFFMDCGLDEYVEVYKTAEQFVKDQNRVKKLWHLLLITIEFNF